MRVVSDESAFIKAIAANPTDTLLPLVYADWFDERGDPRGRLLRVWVDLSWRASHAGGGFRFLLDEYRQLMRAADPDWRREFGTARPWVNAQLAEELVRGYLRYVERRPPTQRGVISGEGNWWTSRRSDQQGWLVAYWTGRPSMAGYGEGGEASWVIYVEPTFGWVYGVATCGPDGWLTRYDLPSGQGCKF